MITYSIKTGGIILVCLIALSLGGCTLFRQSVSAFRSTDHFIAYNSDPRVLFEPGAETYAHKIALFLPEAVREIEEKQYYPFVKPVRIYICESRESFVKMYGADVRAGVLTRLFLSPRIFEDGDKVAKMYLMHELSHLHIRDRIGSYKMSRLPFWFKEGLATYCSHGGGAHLVTDRKALDAIKAGNFFVPNETGGFIVQNTPSDWGMKHHMFYRQSMLFINYLVVTNEQGFRTLVRDVEGGAVFSSALESAYRKDLKGLWKDFLNSVKSDGSSIL